MIIPVYNVEPYLRRCLDSVQAQTYPRLEVILVDDGSTDASGQICDAYAAADRRFAVIHQPNGGLSAARNAGLARAKGTFLAFLDSDDAVTPEYITYLYQLTQKYHADLAISPLLEIYPSGKTHNQGQGYRSAALAPDKCLQRLLCEQGFNVCAYAKLYHKRLFQNLEFPVGKLHEDLGTTYQAILRATAIAYGPRPQYQYYIRRNSLATSAYSKRKLDIITLTDEMCRTIDAVYPGLQNATSLRRLHARFSVLRQMPARLPAADRRARREIVAYIKQHQSAITHNPLAARRDRLALRTFRLGLPVFRLAWRVYARLWR